MQIDIYTQAFWFRYIGREPIELENKTAKLVLQGRAIYGLHRTRNDKYFVIGQPDYHLEEYFPVQKGIVEMLIKSSKPYMGKILDKDIEPGGETIEKTFGGGVVKVKEQQPDPIMPKVSGSNPVELVPLSEAKMIKVSKGPVPIAPPTDRIYEMIKKATAFLGVKVKFKRPVTVCVSNVKSTSIVGIFNSIRGSYDIYIILNMRQLQGLFGTISVSGIAQVLTHELAHYIMNHKVMKQSDLQKFKGLIAAKAMHKDQFNHPGYSYPWWHEAWAVLCEAMVHGQSARGFSSELGWELAEKYFVNRYLKNGNYTGSHDSM